MNKIINKILEDLSLDPRIEDGIFNIENNQHIGYLYEYLKNKNIDENLIIEFIQPLMEKGKYPERQAYNVNGILVTFPTPEYKKRAIARGTHFEKNPKAAQSNLFGGGQQAPNQPSPVSQPTTTPMDAGQSKLPPTDSSKEQEPPTKKEVPDAGTPGTPATPPPASSSSSAPSTSTPAQGQLATEPIPTNTQPQNVSPAPEPPKPPAVKKTPGEIEAEKAVIKQILNVGDTTPTVPGVGGSGITEELKRVLKVALEMNLNEAAKFISKHI